MPRPKATDTANDAPVVINADGAETATATASEPRIVVNSVATVNALTADAIVKAFIDECKTQKKRDEEYESSIPLLRASLSRVGL